MSPQLWVLAHNLSSAAVLGAGTLGVVIWIGVAVLLLALVVIARTRWGQSQPLSKCVVLSVFAHLLLFLYAHGTRLLDGRPTLGSDTSIRVALLGNVALSNGDRENKDANEDASVTGDAPLVGVDPAPEGNEQRASAVSDPWEQIGGQESVTTEEVGPERLVADAAPIDRQAPLPTEPGQTDLIPQTDIASVSTQVVVPENSVPEASKPHMSTLAPVVIDGAVAVAAAAAAVATPPVPIPAPELMTPGRTEVRPLPDGPARSADLTPLPATLMDAGTQIQQLADVAPRPEIGDMTSGVTDVVSESENRGTNLPPGGGVPSSASGSNAHSGFPSIPPTAPPPTVLTAAAPLLISDAIAHVTPRIGDGQPMPEPYRLRSLPAQNEVAAALGGSASATASVDAALVWLASTQENDGSWDPSRWGGGLEAKVAGHDREGAGIGANTGITGLAILAFLGNGQSHLEGTYRTNVQRGLEFLLRSQAPDGSLAGPARKFAKMYCHGMASLALSESLAMTGDTRILPYVEKAVQFTVKAQHPISGGWRYQPGDMGDMSQFGWQVMALKSASLAGVPVPQKTREGMLHFLQRCEQGMHGGLASYQPGERPSRSMTAEALACRYFLDLAPDESLVNEAATYLMGDMPQAGIANEYYWYYATLALYQTQGPMWTRWNEALQRELLKRQRTDGHLAGSWDPDTVWGGYGGRVYTTAMATLTLEVYYRYLPLTALRHP